MTAKTHILGGILAGELLCAAFGPSLASVPVLLAGAVAGALLPDIDHRGSKVSRSSAAGKATSFVVSGLTTHRGVIHTPVFVFAAGAAGSAVSFFSAGVLGPAFPVGLIVGMLSHLVLDTVNPSGIMWLWPISKRRFHLASIRTNSIFEQVFAMALLLVDLYFASLCLPERLSDLWRLMR